MSTSISGTVVGEGSEARRNIDKLLLIDVIEETIDVCSNRLTLVLTTFISYVG
jgi:hypothetical protein